MTMLYWLYCSDLTHDEKMSMVVSNPEYFQVAENLYRDLCIVILVNEVMKLFNDK